MNRYKKVSSKVLFAHPRTTLAEDIITLPDGSKSTYLIYKDLPDSAEMVVKNQDNMYLFCKEYTYPLDDYIYQLPAGVVEPNEEPLQAAHRELKEEAGLIAKRMEYLGHTFSNHRRSTAKSHYYYAHELKETNNALEPHEFISLEWFSLDQVKKLIETNKILHTGSLAAWAFYTTKFKL
jgi:ADP-ribose pyrophosphatase